MANEKNKFVKKIRTCSISHSSQHKLQRNGLSCTRKAVYYVALTIPHKGISLINFCSTTQSCGFSAEHNNLQL